MTTADVVIVTMATVYVFLLVTVGSVYSGINVTMATVADVFPVVAVRMSSLFFLLLRRRLSVLDNAQPRLKQSPKGIATLKTLSRLNTYR